MRGTDKINSRFIFHYLRTVNFIPFLSGGDRAKLTKAKLVDIPIPVPCPADTKKSIEIQKEIVRILDSFTELTAELTARKKQYNYYREKLLSFEDGEVEWKTLGEVADYEQPTKYIVKSNNYSDKFKTPVLTAGKSFILGYTDETKGIYEASKVPVIIFDDFTTANKWVDFDFKIKSSAMKMITSKDETKVLLKYIYYWLNTLPSGLVEGDHKRHWIRNYSIKEIPIPPLSVQKEIVRILDSFTELAAELTAELTARKKQYDYYRDLLLTFPKNKIE